MTSTARRAARTTVVGLTSLAIAAFGALVLTSPASATPELDQVRERVQQVSDQVDKLYREAGIANERLLKAQGEYEDATKELESATKSAEEQAEKLAQMTADMGGFAAAAYREGMIDSTLHLFLSDDENALAESMMLDAYADQQAASLAVVAAERAELTAKQADVEEKTALLEDIEQEIEKEKQALDSKVEEAESLLASLKEEEREILAEIEAERQLEEERRAEAAARTARDDEREQIEQQEEQTDTSASTAATEAEPEPQPAAPSASGRAAAAVNFAMAQIGDAYVYGGTGPNGWDCSGLTSGAWAAAGVSIPRTSQGQLYGLPRVSASAVQPGDLVVYYSGASHVAMYIGNGQIVHASRPGRPVHVAPMYSMPMVGIVRPG